MAEVVIRTTTPFRNQWIHIDDWVDQKESDLNVHDTQVMSGHIYWLEETCMKPSWYCAVVRETRKEAGVR